MKAIKLHQPAANSEKGDTLYQFDANSFKLSKKKNQTQNKQAKTQSQVTYYFTFAENFFLPLGSKIPLLTSFNFPVNTFLFSLLLFQAILFHCFSCPMSSYYWKLKPSYSGWNTNISDS